MSSSPFQELKLSRYDDDDEEEEEARAKANKEHHNLPPLNDQPQTTNAEESPSNDLNEDVPHEER